MSVSLPPLGRATVFILLVATTARQAVAQSRYVLDQASSEVTFHGRALVRSIVGRSEELAGSVSIRDGDVRSMRGNVRFPVRSLETEPEMQPREIDELFGADRHPEIVFFVDSISAATSKGDLFLHGRLIMNGVSRPVAFLSQATFADRRMIASGTATVDLREWRIKAPRRLGGLIGMSSKIRLTFRAEFRARGATHTASAKEHLDSR